MVNIKGHISNCVTCNITHKELPGDIIIDITIIDSKGTPHGLCLGQDFPVRFAEWLLANEKMDEIVTKTLTAIEVMLDDLKNQGNDL